jgi:hypothetical protein
VIVLGGSGTADTPLGARRRPQFQTADRVPAVLISNPDTLRPRIPLAGPSSSKPRRQRPLGRHARDAVQRSPFIGS